MLVVFVNEVAFSHLEGLIHAVESQVVPVGREAEEFVETARVELDQLECNGAVQKVVICSEPYLSLGRELQFADHYSRVLAQSRPAVKSLGVFVSGVPAQSLARESERVCLLVH